MKVALAQINTTVGDIEGNVAKVEAAYRLGCAQAADLVVTPELVLTGYPPRDLLLRGSFVRKNLEALDRLARTTESTGLVVGFVDESAVRPGRSLANGVALLHHGRVQAVRHKSLLPTYDVFDEDRYFEPANCNAPVEFRDQRLGLTVCEDLWNDEDFWSVRRYRRDPVLELVQEGAELLINVSASPWHLGKNRTRAAMLGNLAAKSKIPLVYCNLVGGNDELVFDGRSLVFDALGRLIGRGPLFEEGLVVVDTAAATPLESESLPDEEKAYRALVLGLRDYVGKCGFRSVVLGLSGGIDSALTACIAAESLGAEQVHGISLPSPYSSSGSLEDARLLAAQLGIRYDVIPIASAFAAVQEPLRGLFAGKPEDVTEENLQARLRGVMLMALSNKFGSLLLTTGNKSEMAVGYCTLYGDMCGGLSVLSDVPKTMVYRLARWVNREREVIPESTLTKPPSAELRPDQTDQDSLPPYDTLDAILEAYVVEGVSPAEIVARGTQPDVVERVVRLIDQSEYKRRQAAPGLKVTTKAFGIGRRIPIAQRFHESWSGNFSR